MLYNNSVSLANPDHESARSETVEVTSFPNSGVCLLFELVWIYDPRRKLDRSGERIATVIFPESRVIVGFGREHVYATLEGELGLLTLERYAVPELDRDSLSRMR